MLRRLLLVSIIISVPYTGEAQSPAGPSSPFTGSVPTGMAIGTSLSLTLEDAIGRAMTSNLGLINSAQDVRTARADWLESVNRLVPDVTAKVSATTEQVDLASLGFSGVPGIPLPQMVGPFSYVDARGFISQSVFNWANISSTRSASATREAAGHWYRSARELVVQATASAYLLASADVALVDATRAQIDTATALEQKTIDQNQAGVVASIDVLRSRVELQTQQQRLIAAENQLAIDKLKLARIIGLPTGQAFTLADDVPYRELATTTVERALEQAYASRPDYQAAQAQVRAATLDRESAVAERYPSASVDLSYGDIGTTFARSHGTFSVAGSVTIPIFQGTSVQSNVLRADATLQRARADRDDLMGRIDYDVRAAFLNLTSATRLVEVATSNLELARQTLGQAQDRLSAGVTDNLEVVHAQESVASANQAYISSVYTHNAAKVSLALAMGTAERAALSYLGVR